MKLLINSMKKLLAIIVLSLCFITPSQADDIKDFQIEGMSIGDSLLKYMTEQEIKSSKRNYVKNKRFYIVGYNKNSELYDTVDIYLKTGDKKFIIRTIGGTILIDYKNCSTKKKVIVDDVQKAFPLIKPLHAKTSHSFDKSGKSKQIQTAFLLKGKEMDDHIRIECTNWSKKYEKKGWGDNISVAVFSKEILQWFFDGYN